MKATFAFVLSSCFLAAVLAQNACIEQEECAAGTCCSGYPPFGGFCKNMTVEGGKCHVVDKTVPIFGDFYIGTCPCEEGLVCVQEGKKKNNGICQVPPTTAAPTEAVVDEGGDSDDAASDDAASAEAAPAEAAPEAVPAEE